MLIAIVALAFSSTPLLEDRAFLAAHERWAACTNLAADAQTPSTHSAEEVAAAALAACTAEQEATRRAVFANVGESQGPETMRVVLGGDRDGLVDRVRENRRRLASGSGGSGPGPSYEVAVAALFHCQKNYVDAALPTGRPDREIIEGALRACPDEEAAADAAALRLLGGDRAGADRLMAESRSLVRAGLPRYIADHRRH
jgi:hypothetical protein